MKMGRFSIIFVMTLAFVMAQAQVACAIPVITNFHGVPVLKIDGEITLVKGITYHFTRHTYEEWNKDLKLMKDAGVNVIRADFAWKDVEPEKGLWNFEKIDRFLNLASLHGLYVVPTFSYACADDNFPVWYFDPTRDNSMRNIWGDRPWGNFPTPADEQFVEDYCNYIRNVVEHIKDHPVVIAYNPYNEPHFPEDEVVDYSNYAGSYFRKWLREKYGNDINNLNIRWKANYADFADIEIPYIVPRHYSMGMDEPGTREKWEDFRNCMFEVWQHFVNRMIGAIKSVDPEKPVMINEMAWWLWGQMVESCANPVRIFENADIIGIDIYPNDPIREGNLPASIVKFMRDIFPEKLVWICEINAREGFPDEKPMKEWLVGVVREGASGVMFFQWTDRWAYYDGGAYGLVDESSEPHDQYFYLKNIYDYIEKHYVDLWKNLCTSKPKVAVLWSEKATLHADREIQVAYNPWGVFYNATNMDITLRYFYLEGTKEIPDEPVIIVPTLIFLDDEAKEFLSRCLETGKVLLVEGHFGLWIDNGTGVEFSETRKALHELFGIEYVGEGTGYINAKPLGIEEAVPESYFGEAYRGGTPLAFWEEDGMSACVEVKVKNGTAIIIGTHVFSGTLWEMTESQFELAKALIKYAEQLSENNKSK